ncbi:hypothetical protein [Tenacibaculum xiamenense]|uniref:hypothetical protein n=1 Tax=Tenacibaculum xiamenense TaxID=1261553 RepID=UPI0038933DC3
MKKLITLIISFISYVAMSQNTFPSSGKVGVNTTLPQEELEVNGTTKMNQLIVGNKTSLPPFIHAWYEGGAYTNIFLNNSSQSEDRGLWGISAVNGDFTIITEKDDFSAVNQAFKIVRGSGINVDKVLFPIGNIGIGTDNPGLWKLAVNGKIRAKEIKVETGWSDFVFEDTYDLPTLEEVEDHIKSKGHLKDIPSAKEVETNGVLLGEMDSKLLQKIEELTLYMIELNKRVKTLEEENKILKEKLVEK